MSTNHMTAAGNYQNLFVAKLPLSVTDSELMFVFSNFSPSNATVMLDPVSGRSKGYAFVLFPSEAFGRSAAAALDQQSATVSRPNGDSFTFDLTIFASKHTGREVAAENECLYIRNIPNTWPMPTVENFIAQHGKPVYSAVRSDHLGSPVWVVFVEYDSVESARQTLKALHGFSLGPRSPPILAKYAESEDVKKNRRNRKMGRSRYNAPNPTQEEEITAPTAIMSENITNVSKGKNRIDVAHQMHHPCHATHYDSAGSRVALEHIEMEPLKAKCSIAPICAIPRPRSFNQTTSMGSSIQLPLPRSKQTPVSSPTAFGPKSNYFGLTSGNTSCASVDGIAAAVAKMPIHYPTPMSTTDSNHYISSSSASSSSGRLDDSISPCQGNRYRHNPYAQAYIPTANKH